MITRVVIALLTTSFNPSKLEIATNKESVISSISIFPLFKAVKVLATPPAETSTFI